MTLATAAQCDETTARALTDQLRQSLAVSWELLVEAYQRRAWAALGYGSWDAYTDAELGEARLRLPREQRREVVASMTEAGMSTRAIGSALGVADQTVRADQSKVRDFTQQPEPVEAEIVDDEPDTLGDRIARELAASDESYAEQAAVAPEPRPVLGTDGKTYTATPKPQQQRRRPLPDVARDAGWELRKAVEKVQRLIDDDRFHANAQEVTAQLRSHLLFAAETCQGLNGRLSIN